MVLNLSVTLAHRVTAPSGLTDPDGHTVVKWETADGSDSMAPGETRPIDELMV